MDGNNRAGSGILWHFLSNHNALDTFSWYMSALLKEKFFWKVLHGKDYVAADTFNQQLNRIALSPIWLNAAPPKLKSRNTVVFRRGQYIYRQVKTSHCLSNHKSALKYAFLHSAAQHLNVLDRINRAEISATNAATASRYALQRDHHMGHIDNEPTTKTLHTSIKHEHSNRLSLNSTHIWALKVSQEIAYITTTDKLKAHLPLLRNVSTVSLRNKNKKRLLELNQKNIQKALRHLMTPRITL